MSAARLVWSEKSQAMPGGGAVSSGPSSLQRAFEGAAGAPAGIAGADVEPAQLDLLRGEDGKLPANVFQLIRKGEARGRGRPPGSGNKRSAKLAQLICEQHGDPVLYLASLYSMPLDQMVELMRLADGAAEIEERLFDLAERIETHIAELVQKSSPTEKQLKLADRLVDRLGDIAKVLRNKPGDLAAKAMLIQEQAAKEVALYVHSKKPVAVQVSKKTEGVLIIPGLNAPAMDPKALEDRLRKDGTAAVDFDSLELLPVVEAAATEVSFDDQDGEE